MKFEASRDSNLSQFYRHLENKASLTKSQHCYALSLVGVEFQNRTAAKTVSTLQSDLLGCENVGATVVQHGLSG